MTAYLLLALVLWHAIDAVRAQAPGVVARGAWLLVAAVLLQAVLGILTLLNQVPIDLALSHQAVAIVVLTHRGDQSRAVVAAACDRAISERLAPVVG